MLARVIVNRLWQHHFGRGLVSTPNDFGAQGDKPTHPELLDYLASELIKHQWRLKPIQKLILTSAVYMQGNEYDEHRNTLDPENLLLWRRPLIRLEAEVIRDSMLSVSGQLDATMFGPGSLDDNMKRRSIYFFVKRSHIIPLMLLFDAPNALTGMGSRAVTTVAPQALAMMNNPQVQGFAKAFESGIVQTSIPASVSKGYKIAFGREPTERELSDACAFVEEQKAKYQADGKQDNVQLALVDFCQAILSLNEFMYVE